MHRWGCVRGRVLPARRMAVAAVLVLSLAAWTGTAQAGPLPGDFQAAGVPVSSLGTVGAGLQRIRVVYSDDTRYQSVEPASWSQLFSSLGKSALTAGGDRILDLGWGERLGPGPGPARWLMGVAARVSPPGESALECEYCMVDWLPVARAGGDVPLDSSATPGDSLLYWNSHLRLAEAGLYLLPPGIGARDSAPNPPGSRSSPRSEPTARLALQLELKEPSEASRSNRFLTARLFWKVNGLPYWSTRIQWRPRADRDDTREMVRTLYADLSGMDRVPDSDGDGVPDSRDHEPWTENTSAGVDAFGVANDRDHDGVPDWRDLEPDTPSDMLVDSKGRRLDDDHDGVTNSRDHCPNTPPEDLVDSAGCSIVIPCEGRALIATGLITAHRIYFETGSATLTSESRPALDSLGAALMDLPALEIEVGGHCDERGSDELNQQLSESRAQSVITYLISNRSQLERNTFRAVGYGRSRPLSDESTPEAWARNRRVEFVLSDLEKTRLAAHFKTVLKRGVVSPCGGEAAR